MPRFDISTPRHQPFRFEIGVPGLDLSGRGFTFEARAVREAGVPIVDLDVGGGADGIVAALLDIDGGPYTLITLNAAKATMEAVPLPTPADTDSENWYSFKMDGRELLWGRYVVTPQANHS